MRKIGITRALHSYYHFPMWQKFFTNLDCEIILSPATTKKILAEGIKIAPEEICLPVKAFLGHCAYLKDRCDYLLIPRMVCMLWQNQNSTPNPVLPKKQSLKYGCPKSIGLPDIVRACFNDSVKIIDLTIDERKINQRYAYYEIGQFFSSDKKKILQAYDIASDSPFETSLGLSQWAQRDNLPTEKFSIPHVPTIGIIGHPYLIYDAYISLCLISLIEKLNVKVITPIDVIPRFNNLHQKKHQKNSDLEGLSVVNNIQSTSTISLSSIQNRNANNYHHNQTSNCVQKSIEDVHWFYEQDIINSTKYLLENKLVSGIIFASSFSCGTASVVLEIIKKELLASYRIPTLTIFFDEHTTAVGLTTRIESFIELIQRAGFSNETDKINNLVKKHSKKLSLRPNG